MSYEKQNKEKEFIDKFITEALENTGSFDIAWTKDGCKDVTYYHFMQDRVGRARYIYGSYSWNDSVFFAEIKNKPVLAAIVAEGKVYIVDDYMFSTYIYRYQNAVLPENAILFDKYVGEVTEYANKEVLEEYLETLETTYVPEKLETDVEETARRVLFTGKSPERKWIKPLNMNDVARFLCGYIVLGLKEEIIRRLEQDRAYWVAEKTLATQIERLIQEPSLIAEPWEMEMAKGLREVPDAKSVNVEFVMNGSKANGKMEPSTLMRILVKGDGGKIDDYDFINCSEGKGLYYLFGANYYKNPLTCKHITKISYGKRLLFDEKLVEVNE